MNYLLKIVQGPHAGAEIALVEGSVTFGSSDACDIVLADSSLPAEAFALEASDAGVTLKALPDGEARALDLYTLFTFGNSSFAVGENGVPWPELKAPPPPPPPEPPAEAPDAETESPAPQPAPAPEAPSPAAKPQRRGLGCIPTLVLALLLFFAGFFVCHYLTWYWPDSPVFGRPDAAPAREASPAQSAVEPAAPEKSLADWAAEHGVAVSERDGETVLAGNFTNRTERLLFAQDAYARDQDLSLDLSDDETLRAGVEEVLFAQSEGRVKLATATNRVVKLVGRARSRAELLQTVAAICTDVNRVRVVDDTAVVCDDGQRTKGPTRYQALSPQAARHHPFVTPAAKPGMPEPKCPVAGVILMPYPCLVLRDGSRAAEGSMVGEFKVEKIEADKVTLKRGEETVTWKP